MGTQAAEDYYTQEHQISVAKYNPYQAIKLYNRIDLVTSGGGTTYFAIDGDVESSIEPFIGATVVSPEQSPSITGLQHIKVTGVSYISAFGETRVDISPDFTASLDPNSYVSLIESTMTNKTGENDWPGDPDFLEDKFVRFSYRFKFDDNEYSLMAPFTQIAYIPKQNGFFLNGDEETAYQSTIIPFMENQVQNIGLVIPLPTKAGRIANDYKIKELEILFRESDGVAVKVLESVSVGTIVAQNGTLNYYTYDYQSRKPYKTLPEAQTTRVYDKVPVRAFSQESSGNRIIYGNYRDQHTPPPNINYNCRISQKSTTGKYNNWVEYPNHSVKRNRNYQVGFVLADKFGRQSPVILSSVDKGVINNGQFYFGSTIYSPYNIAPGDTDVKNWFGDAIMVLVNSEITSTKNLAAGTPGLYAIKQNAGSGSGEGYAEALGGNSINGNTYNFRLNVNPPLDNNNNIPRVGDYLRGAYQDFVEVLTVTETNPTINQWQVTTDGEVSSVYLRAEDLPSNGTDLKFAYTINDLGWYSYKIVVKQTQQEYYNVYLPGILNGYPGQSGATNLLFPETETLPSGAVAGGIDNGLFPSDETNETAFTVLFNDNINKIPRDLSEVGPDEKQYRSSVVLYGRVSNIMTVGTYDSELGISGSEPYNSQYYARINSTGKTAIQHTSTAIARAKEVNMGYADLSTSNDQHYVPLKAFNTGAVNGNKVFYQIDTNPLIARISTVNKSIGASALNFVLTEQEYAIPGGEIIYPADNLNNPLDTANMRPYLAVYETEPVESLLEIFWETASEGLIVDLNADVLSTSGGATSFIDLTWDFTEATLPGEFVTGWFIPVNISGEVFQGDTPTAELIGVTNGDDEEVSDLFDIHPGTGNDAGKFKLKYIGANPLVFLDSSRETDVYSFVVQVTTNGGDDINDIPIEGFIGGFGALRNLTPTLSSSSPIPPISTTRETRVIIPGYNDPNSPWQIADPKNGSQANNSNTLQLHYSILNPEDLPDNWAMNSATGELTQAIPGDVIDGVTFGGNISALYNIEIQVSDANASTPIDDAYGSLFVNFGIPITMGYAVVNPGALSEFCIVDPDPLNPLPQASDFIISTDPNSGDAGQVTGIWYIAEEDNSNYLDLQNSAFSEYGLTNTDIDFKKRIGTEAHKSGTIAITANFKQVNEPNQGVTQTNFKFKTVAHYFRLVYSVNDELETSQWQAIPSSREYNRSFQNFEGQAPKTNVIGFAFGSPADSDPIDYATLSEILGVSEGAAKSVQTVRAFDYLKMTELEPGDDQPIGVEYVFIIQDLEQTEGDTTDYPAIAWINGADLHYPTCVPWAGINLAPDADWGENREYEYFRSTPGSTNPNVGTVSTANKLYAETPYTEYVNQFYTDKTMQVPYDPPSETRFVGIQFNREYIPPPGVPAPPVAATLTDWKGFRMFEPTFSVELGEDGVRVQSSNGVNTMPTLLNYEGSLSATDQIFINQAGFTRIKTPK